MQQQKTNENKFRLTVVLVVLLAILVVVTILFVTYFISSLKVIFLSPNPERNNFSLLEFVRWQQQQQQRSRIDDGKCSGKAKKRVLIISYDTRGSKYRYMRTQAKFLRHFCDAHHGYEFKNHEDIAAIDEHLYESISDDYFTRNARFPAATFLDGILTARRKERRSPQLLDIPIFWKKLALLYYYMFVDGDCQNNNKQQTKYDVVMWLDSDAIVLPTAIPFGDIFDAYPDKSIMIPDEEITKDVYNAGIVMIRNDQVGRAFVERCLFDGFLLLEKNKNRWRYDEGSKKWSCDWCLWADENYEQGHMAKVLTTETHREDDGRGKERNFFNDYFLVLPSLLFDKWFFCLIPHEWLRKKIVQYLDGNKYCSIVHLYGQPHASRDFVFSDVLEEHFFPGAQEK